MYKEKYVKYKSKYLDLKSQLDSYPNIIQDGGVEKLEAAEKAEKEKAKEEALAAAGKALEEYMEARKQLAQHRELMAEREAAARRAAEKEAAEKRALYDTILKKHAEKVRAEKRVAAVRAAAMAPARAAAAAADSVMATAARAKAAVERATAARPRVVAVERAAEEAAEEAALAEMTVVFDDGTNNAWGETEAQLLADMSEEDALEHVKNEGRPPLSTPEQRAKARKELDSYL